MKYRILSSLRLSPEMIMCNVIPSNHAIGQLLEGYHKRDQQILKWRDDKLPIYLKKISETKEGIEPFKLDHECECSWLKADETIGPAKLRQRIEPWLTALFQSEHLALLVGSGLSHADQSLLQQLEQKNLFHGMGTIKMNHFDRKRLKLKQKDLPTQPDERRQY